MDVKVVDCTEDPVKLIGMLAGVSRGKTGYDLDEYDRMLTVKRMMEGSGLTA